MRWGETKLLYEIIKQKKLIRDHGIRRKNCRVDKKKKI